jgi:tetratricopeptide (TPR) repeat protein
VCEAVLDAGARYCAQCGAPVRDRPSPLPWVIAGTSLVAAIIVLLLPSIREGRPPQLPAFAGGDPAMANLTPGSPPPLSGTPREQADRLFNRVMEERSAGNNERATFFLPMAIMAYEQAAPLDDDGLYHLSLLQAAAGRGADARATAETILARQPNHLLALAAAAEAAQAAGDIAAARDYFRRFLDNYDAEKDRPLPEYQDHGRILPDYQRAAKELVGRS